MEYPLGPHQEYWNTDPHNPNQRPRLLLLLPLLFKIPITKLRLQIQNASKLTLARKTTLINIHSTVRINPQAHQHQHQQQQQKLSLFSSSASQSKLNPSKPLQHFPLSPPLSTPSLSHLQTPTTSTPQIPYSIPQPNRHHPDPCRSHPTILSTPYSPLAYIPTVTRDILWFPGGWGGFLQFLPCLDYDRALNEVFEVSR
ncbi:hypothetical protein NA56DRAFT_242974 [Hyaloscypha hepaticicola]|uniref:Uncharacterized protein n=1 Tax=Hyaloscypha hepaticicola TaxID=2082293 RepID=A0A2J6PWK4_9HELO|nr:hypothetical protein NA56DRAFT_242974 [Hyaloscypha hepaticicola]